MYALVGLLYTLIGIPMMIFGSSTLKVMGVIYLFGPLWMGIIGSIFLLFPLLSIIGWPPCWEDSNLR